jgi:hypothetical protein
MVAARTFRRSEPGGIHILSSRDSEKTGSWSTSYVGKPWIKAEVLGEIEPHHPLRVIGYVCDGVWVCRDP